MPRAEGIAGILALQRNDALDEKTRIDRKLEPVVDGLTAYVETLYEPYRRRAWLLSTFPGRL